MTSYLADLAFWTLFCWLALVGNVVWPAIAFILALDNLQRR